MTEKDPRIIRLAPNFTLGEFLKPDDPMPPPWILDNLFRLANRLQAVRDILGRAITVTSGYRTAARNQAVGGYPKSYHLYGMAADIVVAEMAAHEVQAFLRSWSGGLGSYPQFTHLDIRPYKARWNG